MLVKPFKDFTIFAILIEVMKKINLSAFVKLNLTSLVYIWLYGGNLNTEQVSVLEWSNAKRSNI